MKEDAKEETALVRRLDPQALILKALENNSGIETLERLFALAKDVRGEQAREAWNEAMSQFQKKCPKIVKTESADIQTRGGARFSYRYASLEGMLSILQPVLTPLGLSVSWRTRIETGKVVANCRISHDLGHFEESGEVVMPIPEEGTSGATAPQRVGIALTYAKRHSLMLISGIAPEEDPDAAIPEKKEPAPMPRRASETRQDTPPGGNVWKGCIKGVTSRSGTTKGKPWTLYSVIGEDGTEFGTFDDKTADFAKEAGASPVLIEWEATDRGGKRIVSIGPSEG